MIFTIGIFLLGFLVSCSYIHCDMYLPQSEYNALNSLYTSTNGLKWSWRLPYSDYGYPWEFLNESNPCNTSRPWQGVNCTSPCEVDSCHIVSISLGEYILHGTLPPELGNLTYLEELDLSYNYIYGTLPEEIYTLHRLEYLELFKNQLTGSLSSSIGQLSSLITLNLFTNQLTGSIPLEITTLPSLQILSIAFNKLTGSLPDSLGNISSLFILHLVDNSLTGPLPASLSNCSDLAVISLYSNLISGPFPRSWLQMTSLLFLDLYSNTLTGYLPDNIGVLYLLRYFRVETNLLSGPLPSTMVNLTLITGYSYSINQFTGTIPTDLDRIVNISVIDFSANYLTGIIPSSIGNLTKLFTLNIYDNYLTGTFPDSLHKLTKLSLFSACINLLTGSLPSSYGNMKKLSSFQIYTNFLTGSLPLEIGNMTSLGTFDFYSNLFTGSLPETLGSIPILISILAFDNMLTGTLPASMGNNEYMFSLDLENNLLTGPIPASYANWSDTEYLFLSSNSLTGTVPSFLFQDIDTTEIALTNNFFSGSLPNENIYSQSQLQVLDLSSNMLTNCLPSSIFTIKGLIFFSIGDNYMTNTLPNQLFDGLNLTFLEVSNNYFIGTLPSQGLSKYDMYSYLDFSTNLLTGSYPYDVYQHYFHHLNYMSLANNYFTGPLPKQIGGPSIKVIYLQNNSFTGSIASELVANKNNLTVFMASLNCLTGTIPESFCDNHQLSQLILDGLHSSEGCIDRLFSFDDKSSYYTVHGVHGTLPTCFFSMPLLQVLHMSGNNIHGTIPYVSQNNSLPAFENQNMSHLRSLILANNLLTGTIPSSLWTDQMIYLDLSFNQFTASELAQRDIQFLSHGFPDSLANLSTIIAPSLHLQVNHLSGKISKFLTENISSGVDIDILEGNMFTCDSTRNDLPSKDPNYDTYQCGSDYTNISLYVSISLFVLLLLLMGYSEGRIKLLSYIRSIVWLGKENLQILDQVKQSNPKLLVNNLIHISQTLNLLGRILLFIIVWAVMILIPTYIGLSMSYGTYEHQYVWVLSSAYLFGQTPAIVLLVLFSVIVCIISYVFLHIPSHLTLYHLFQHHICKTNNQITWKNIFSQERMWKTFKLIVFLVVETGVVLLVNSSYVLALNHGYDNVTITWISLAISAFKLIWGNIILLGAGRLILEHYLNIRLHTGMIIGMSIFNNVIAPYLAEALVSSNCFYYAITSSPTVNSYYYSITCTPVYQCINVYDTVMKSSVLECSFSVNCDKFQELFTANDGSLINLSNSLSSSSYNPPFHYNYTCSSSLLSAFAYIFVYRYLFTGIIEPLFFYLIKWIQRNSVLYVDNDFLQRWSCGQIQDKHKWFLVITNLLPLLMKFESFSEENQEYTFESLKALQQTLSQTVSPAEKSIVRLITDITVMLSFGVLFPPLGILIFISLIKDMLREQQLLGILYQAYVSVVVLSTRSSENYLANSMKSVLEDLLLQLNECYEVWMVQFWMGWWWSVLVAVWFWSFSLYDTLARVNGPVSSLWILFVMGLSPFWMRGIWIMIVKIINMKIQSQGMIHETNEIDKSDSSTTEESIINPVFQLKIKQQSDIETCTISEERLTELTIARDSFCNEQQSSVSSEKRTSV